MTILDNLPTAYEPQRFESDIRAFWEKDNREKRNFFHATPDDPEREGDAYVIVIPPPNVTGALHGGHALNNTLQDILIRWHRMRGYNTLWMPGTDHAGIATQAVVERTIFEKEKMSRHDLGREEMVRRIWEWKEQYGNRIINQLKLMGCSCDWERTRFTLDDMCAKAVRHTFFKLFKDGLIVRGKRLVNWDTHLQTAVADDEVYHETTKGHFYHFKYPIKKLNPDDPNEPQEYAHIATTRPETMLGDTAVAVHPDPEGALNNKKVELEQQLAETPEKDRPAIQAQLDDIAERLTTRLDGLIKLRDMAKAGRKLILPLVDREIPLIADEWAKPELGSGCVKITPAHDPNDYEVGQRHKLPMCNVMSPDGKVAKLENIQNETARKYEGMKFSTVARKAIVEDLEALGLVEKIEDRMIEIGHSDRSKTPIEPFLSDQWFVRMGDLPAEEAAKIEGLRGTSGLAQLAMDAVAEEPLPTPEQRRDSGKVHFFPGRYRKTYTDWLSEKRDWCISRQLWWGHRIPVWGKVCGGDKDEFDQMQDTLSIWVEDGRIARQAFSRVLPWTGGNTQYQIPLYISVLDPEDREVIDYLENNGFVQDPDVLDTWFSSALWPHSTLGWPDNTAELQRYYPGSVLSTAREIITLWVARMVLTGMYNIGKVPFHDVYIHAVIQDGQGRPFKKTLGNGFDPVDIIEVYGADALRFTMASLTTETQDIRMPMKKVKLEDGRELQSSERFELGRNFCNKLWNASRFAFMNLSVGLHDVGPASSRSDAGGDSRMSENKKDDRQDAGPTQSSNEPGGSSPRSSSIGTPFRKLDVKTLPIEDRWILSQTSRAVAEVQNALLGFQFARATTAARDFFWDVLCDWYVELVKPRISAGRDSRTSEASCVGPASSRSDAREEDRQDAGPTQDQRPSSTQSQQAGSTQDQKPCPTQDQQAGSAQDQQAGSTQDQSDSKRAAEARQVLAFVLDQSLRLLHPFVPYITEGLWKILNQIAPQRGLPGIAEIGNAGELDCGEALIVAKYPPVTGYPSLIAPEVDAVFADLQTATRAVREIRQTCNIPPKQPMDVSIKVPADRVASLQHEAHVIQKLANVGALTIGAEVAKPANAATLMIGDMQIFVANVIDANAERVRLEKELANFDKQIAGIEGKLGNEQFVSGAPAEIVEREKARLADLQAKRETVVQAMAELG